MTSKLLALDPGLATGAVLIKYTEEDTEILYAEELDIVSFREKIPQIIYENRENLTVVIEDFKITVATGKLSDAPWSLKLIGLTEYLCWAYGVKLYYQLPSEKPFAPNDMLKKIGFWFKGGEGHANDAFRHAVIWFSKHKSNFVKKIL